MLLWIWGCISATLCHIDTNIYVCHCHPTLTTAHQFGSSATYWSEVIRNYATLQVLVFTGLLKIIKNRLQLLIFLHLVWCCYSFCLSCSWTVHPKMNILSSFINPQVVSNLYEFLLLNNSMEKYCGISGDQKRFGYQHYSNDDKIFIFRWTIILMGACICIFIY